MTVPQYHCLEGVVGNVMIFCTKFYAEFSSERILKID